MFNISSSLLLLIEAVPTVWGAQELSAVSPNVLLVNVLLGH